MADYAVTCPRLSIPLEHKERVSLTSVMRPLLERLAGSWRESGDMTKELYRCKGEYADALEKHLYRD